MSHTSLHIETIGQGQDIVMLHGWGVNSAVFTPLHSALTQYRVHYVDLPGFGHSPSMEGDIHAWVDAIVQAVPANAIWAGWSLGGLIATLAAIKHPDKIKALATITSSPCFMARESESWPGIPPQVLYQFGTQLSQDIGKTIERFLAIQAMGSATAKEDIKQLRALVLARPLPAPVALIQGLDMLENVDLRSELNQITLPWLRIWGRRDGLVSRRVIPLMPQNPAYEDLTLTDASHAPFISHPETFLSGFETWLNKLI